MYLKTNNHVFSLDDCIYAKCEGKSIYFSFNHNQTGSVTFNCRETADAVFDAVAKQISNPYATVIATEYPVKGGSIVCDVYVHDNSRRELL